MKCELTACKRRGQFHHKAKLTDREVELARRMHEDDKISYNKLAVIFEASKASIQRICTYRTR
jgi:hypothetical protein